MDSVALFSAPHYKYIQEVIDSLESFLYTPGSPKWLAFAFSHRLIGKNLLCLVLLITNNKQITIYFANI